ncbi:MAG TPA: hypothetical protein VLJ41_13435 [Segetibacter sp.]|nr:hypothetical protein [Segetibacter sp.]
MKSKFYFIALSISISTPSFYQQNEQSVIATAGDISKAGDISLEWTLGERAIESVSTSSSLYTQGFHQPLLEVQRINYAGNLNKSISIMPR